MPLMTVSAQGYKETLITLCMSTQSFKPSVHPKRQHGQFQRCSACVSSFVDRIFQHSGTFKDNSISEKKD